MTLNNVDIENFFEDQIIQYKSKDLRLSIDFLLECAKKLELIKSNKRSAIEKKYLHFFIKEYLKILDIDFNILAFFEKYEVDCNWGYVYVRIFFNDRVEYVKNCDNVTVFLLKILNEKFVDFCNMLKDLESGDRDILQKYNFNFIFVLINQFYPLINRTESKEFINKFFVKNCDDCNINGIIDFIFKLPKIFRLRNGLTSWFQFENQIENFIYSLLPEYSFDNIKVLSSHCKSINNKNYILYKVFDQVENQVKRFVLRNNKLSFEFNFTFTNSQIAHYDKYKHIDPYLYNFEKSNDKIPIIIWYNFDMSIKDSTKFVCEILKKFIKDVELNFDIHVPILYTNLTFNELINICHKNIKGIFYSGKYEEHINLPIKQLKLTTNLPHFGGFYNLKSKTDLPFIVSNEKNYSSDLLEKKCKYISILSYYKYQTENKDLNIYDLINDYLTINYPHLIFFTLLNEFGNYHSFKCYNSIIIGKQNYEYNKLSSKFGDREIELFKTDNYAKLLKDTVDLCENNEDFIKYPQLVRALLLCSSNLDELNKHRQLTDINKQIIEHKIEENNDPTCFGYSIINNKNDTSFYIKVSDNPIPIINIAICWNSKIVYDQFKYTNVMSCNNSDFDILLYDDNDNLVSHSTSWDNNFEYISFRCRSNKIYKIIIKNWSNSIDNVALVWCNNEFFSQNSNRTMDHNIQSKLDMLLEDQLTDTVSDIPIDDSDILGYLVSRFYEDEQKDTETTVQEDEKEDEEEDNNKASNQINKLERNLHIMEDFDNILSSRIDDVKKQLNDELKTEIKKLEKNGSDESTASLVDKFNNIESSVETLSNQLDKHKKATKSSIHELDNRMNKLISAIMQKK
jgi:hypothetical protein